MNSTANSLNKKYHVANIITLHVSTRRHDIQRSLRSERVKRTTFNLTKTRMRSLAMDVYGTITMFYPKYFDKIHSRSIASNERYDMHETFGALALYSAMISFRRLILIYRYPRKIVSVRGK